ncbi:protein kinase domain-containing protein [Pseudonocardia oroxyli]|uniref:protein kinase domain-containing protein n=1 Tax=Pseudonocardia oroxyli TaxID=366584 RepID=UPI0015A22394|nr:protein kinase [Pseudonocardia oroxyli]
MHRGTGEAGEAALQQIGHYRLEELLGVGGMGEVYRAFDTRRDRMVALKLLPEGLAKDPEFLRRFRRESHVAARLREPHVIPIHDYGELDGRLFIDMRLVDGENLRTMLERTGPLAPEEAVAVITQVAEALEAAHADGLVHRDIKPSNVLVTPGGFVYVVDFGIARTVGTARTSVTITGVTVGTLDYMAPERFTNQTIDGRTDVYSLACLLYECLTATGPFPGEDLPSLMFNHLYTDPPRPSEAQAGLPAALDDVVTRGMAKSLDGRFPTPTALAAAAKVALQSGAAPAAPARPLDRTVQSVLAAPPADLRTATPVAEPPLPAVPAVPEPPVVEEPVADEPVAAPADPDATTRITLGEVPPPPAGAEPPPTDDGDRTVVIGAGTPPPPLSAPKSGRGRTWVAVGASVLAAALAAVLVFVLVRPGTPAAATHDHDAAAPTGPVPTVAQNAAVPAAEQAAPQVATAIAVPTVNGTIPVGPTPGYLEVAPNGRFAYIANRDAGVVTVLDTKINQVTATIPIPAGPPQFVSFSPDGSRAYVSIYNTEKTVNLIGVLDTSSNTLLTTIPVGKRPFASATTQDGKLLYVPSHDDGKLDLIDTTTDTVVQEITVPPNPHWVVFSKDGKTLYTANHESNVVSVLDVATNTVRTTIPVGTSPHATALSPDGSRVSVVNFDSSTVSVIDTATNAVVATVPVGKKPQDIAYTADGHYLYTANVDGNSVSVIDTATNQITATIPAPSPTSVSMLPNGRQAYVTLLGAGEVMVLDASAT